MNACEACGQDTADLETVIVRGLADVPGIVEVGRCCLEDVLRRHRLHPVPPTLHEELVEIFDLEGAA